MTVYFDPLDRLCKSRTGAISRSTEITFQVFRDECGEGNFSADCCTFVFCRDGEMPTEFPMQRTENGWKISLRIHREGLYFYHFRLDYKYLSRSRLGIGEINDFPASFQLTVYAEEFQTPDWMKGGIMYQIFPDRFCKQGDIPAGEGKELRSDWGGTPHYRPNECGKVLNNDFFGGNAAGIREKLPYLRSLGVTAIYLTPVFLSSSNHRYDTADYLKIDDLFGGEEEFRRLVADAKKAGISVILDGVFNHTGADSVYFNKFGNFPGVGAYGGRQSPYYDWYTFFDFPDDYHCWWGSTVVPTVNKSAEGWRELVLGRNGVIDKWTKAGVRGWRLDVVDELPTDFTEALCAAIRGSGKDSLVIGEVWEDASDKVSYGTWRPYFMGDELDGVMNYPFRRAIFDLVMRGDRGAFRDEVALIAEHYPKESLDASLTLLGSHDTVRALTALSGVSAPATKEERRGYRLPRDLEELAALRLKAAAILQYTLPGIPCVYYGDEAGMQGFEDPLNRATYPWGRERDDLLAHYKALGVMRARNKEALTGRLRFREDDELAVFDRVSEDGRHILTVRYNPCLHTVEREIDAEDAFTGEWVDSVRIPPLSAYVSARRV